MENKTEMTLNVLMYVILGGLILICFNIFVLNEKNEDNLEKRCENQNSYLIDSSNGYYCFKPVK